MLIVEFLQESTISEFLVTGECNETSFFDIECNQKLAMCDTIDHKCCSSFIGESLSDQFTPRRSLLSLGRIASGPNSSIWLQPEQNPTMAASKNYF